MKIKTVTVGSYSTNCYLAWCPETSQGIVIDPGFEPERINSEIESLGIEVKAVVNTHGHLDHIGGNREVAEKHECPVYISRADETMLDNPDLNCSARLGAAVTSPGAGRLLEDGDEISFGQVTLHVLATPGHTPGSICLKGPGVLFSGDTLFADSVGRTDLPGGSHQQLQESLRHKLFPLPVQTRVLPGHGPETTMEKERQQNPWLQG